MQGEALLNALQERSEKAANRTTSGAVMPPSLFHCSRNMPHHADVLINARELPTMDTPRIQRYLAKAKECEQLAQNVRDRMIKHTFEELARQWRELANQIRELTK